ncbi:3854_t:CDS:2, partial [Funneliformis geosporum]
LTPYDDIINFNVVRGESSSLASSDRKNRGRTIDSRKEMGRRGDAIFRKTSRGIRLEFGGSEANMFIILCENASWDIRKMEEMENIHVLDLPAGYIDDITRLTIAFQAIELITVVWTSKMQVVRTMEILQRTEDDVVNHLKNISTRKKINRQINIEVLPDNQMTPKKR